MGDVAKVAEAEFFAGGFPFVRFVGLIHLNLPGPNVQASEYQRPISVDGAAHEFLHRVFELKVRSLRVDTCQNDRSGVDVETAATKQWLGVLKFRGVPIARVQNGLAETEHLSRVLHDVKRRVAAQCVAHVHPLPSIWRHMYTIGRTGREHVGARAMWRGPLAG